MITSPKPPTKLQLRDELMTQRRQGKIYLQRLRKIEDVIKSMEDYSYVTRNEYADEYVLYDDFKEFISELRACLSHRKVSHPQTKEGA